MIERITDESLGNTLCYYQGVISGGIELSASEMAVFALAFNLSEARAELEKANKRIKELESECAAPILTAVAGQAETSARLKDERDKAVAVIRWLLIQLSDISRISSNPPYSLASNRLEHTIDCCRIISNNALEKSKEYADE